MKRLFVFGTFYKTLLLLKNKVTRIWLSKTLLNIYHLDFFSVNV